MPSLLGLLVLIIMLAFLGALAFLYIVARRRKQWVLTHWTEQEITDNTDITALASKYDVSWKLLASVNHIKAPYTLKKGDTLKVPPQK